MPEGITDLTFSEGNLKRLSRICNLVGLKSGDLNRERLLEKIKNNYEHLKLGNEAVRSRHIRLLEKLGLLEEEDKFIRLTGDGKVLFEFGKDDVFSKHLNNYEKALFLRTLLLHAGYQIRLLLKNLAEDYGADINSLIIRYFESDDQNLWDNKKIDGYIEIYNETGKIFYKSKLDCMLTWLKHLGIISHYKKINMLNIINPKEKLIDRIVENESLEMFEILIKTTSLLDITEASEFNYENDGKIFQELLYDSYNRFKIGVDASDLWAMKLWMSFVLLIDKNRIIDDSQFEESLLKNRDEGVVDSLMRTKEGIVRYVKLS